MNMKRTCIHLICCSWALTRLPFFQKFKMLFSCGQVENAEVQKPKYGKGSTEVRKSHLSVPSALLTHECAL